MIFKNKEEALEKLLDIIEINIEKDLLVLSINERGNFYVKGIANKYGVSEDFLFIEEIKSPINKDTSLGAISEMKDYILIDELINSFEINNDYVFSEAERIYEEKILQNIYKFRGGESIISLRNRNVLLVDESINTGLSLLCAIKSCISKGAKSIQVAVPIAAKESAEFIKKLVDKTYFVYEIEDFVDKDFYFKENK